MMAPFAVEPLAPPTAAPTAAPVVAPMMAPVSFLLSEAQAVAEAYYAQREKLGFPGLRALKDVAA